MTEIEIVEVGPRDGLQNETAVLDTPVKIELLNRLADAGAKRIEAVSFAHPGYVPQMADAEAVMAGLIKRAGVSYIGLVMNERGYRRAVDTPVDELNFSVSATDGFNLANLSANVEDTLGFIEAVAPDVSLPTTATISVVWGCPFDGEVEPERVVEIASRLVAAGIDELALADTIGVANPWAVRGMIDAVSVVTGSVPLRVHFHDTRNTGLANAFAAIESGVRVLDSSVGGLGGCPFAPDATGNIATNDLVYMVERAGFMTGFNLTALNEIAHWVGSELSIQPPSLVARAGGFPKSS
ncbi:MAG: hydroxymethylglutaryl-CoA lyase [Acidimicrobiia bacterium]|nr:hydroxymethylglutaryl-CoA lyase [Acidimicrobiia bacterium]